MVPGPGGVQEVVKEITAFATRLQPDGTLVFVNSADEYVASFKQYVWCLEENAIPVIKPVRSITQ
jgi:hypothetical protein